MARLKFTEGFVDDLAAAYSPRVYERIKRAFALAELFPESGSTQLPDYVIRAFGSKVRVLSVPPFVIVYEYDAREDVVSALGLIHARRLR